MEKPNPSNYVTAKEVAWTIAFLSATVTAVTMELYSAIRQDPEVPAWTTLIVRHVPKPLAMALAVTLSGWLPGHLRKYYKKAGK